MALLKIDEEHATGLEPAFFFDDFWIDGEHANFAGHDHSVIGREIEATGAEAVAVEDRADVAAVAEDDGGGAVPGFHQARVVFIKGPLVLWHRFVILPGFWDHHHHRLR